MLSKHKHLHLNGCLITEQISDSHFLSENHWAAFQCPGFFSWGLALNFFLSSSPSGNCSDISDKLPKPSSKTETSKSCSTGIDPARGISVVLGQKNSHLLLRHRDVSLQFTELGLGKPFSSSMASNSSTGADSEERNGMTKMMNIPSPEFRKSERISQMRSVIIPYGLDEIWSSEEYTCVVVHGGGGGGGGGDQKPRVVTHIFCDYILECYPKWMVGRKRIPTKNSDINDLWMLMSFCSMCNRRLEKEKDIYMFQGEAFCSPLCRNHAVMNNFWAEEVRKVRVDHSSQVPHETADTDHGKNLFTLGIPIVS